jgi:PAS domain S-box-containing protein
MTVATPSSVRLLVVDDDLRFPDYLRVLLRSARASFVINAVDTVRDALRELAQGRYHICLLDYRLGEEDGLDVLRFAQARGLQTPIVLLTGDSDDTLEFTALEEGAADYLNKSDIDPLRLERIVYRTIARHRADLAFREREARLAEAEASTLVMTAHLALDGRWLRVPRRLSDLLGYTQEELLDLHFQDVTHADDVAYHLTEQQRLLDGCVRTIELEKRYIRRGGGIVWIYQNCSLVRAENGTPLYFLAYLRDISDQKHAEEALRISESRKRAILESAFDAIVTVDGTGCVVEFNSAAERIFGCNRHEVIGRDAAHLLAPPGDGAERPPFERLWERARASGDGARFEMQALRRDGHVFPVEVTVARFFEGTGVTYSAFMRDLSTQRSTEHALAASEQRYASMIRNAPFGIFEALRDGRFRAVNPALVAMLGYESEHEVLAVAPDGLYGGSEERIRVLDQLVAGQPTGVETRWTRQNGSTVLVRITAHFAPGAGDVITAVVEDITERKRLEDQLRHAHKMEAIGQLAGGVAHDFNNLLTAILGYTAMLKDRCSHLDDVRADLEEVHNAGKSAAALTEQLLAFSRKQVLKPKVLCVNSVIRGLENLVSRVLGEDIALETKLADEIPPIEADPVQLQQVVLNLAANARDAMPRGGTLLVETADLTLGAAAALEVGVSPGRYVRVSVADTGCGMDEATLSRIFEPFFTTKAGKGTGLGLATAYGIVKQTGGEIVCVSEPNAGTKFSIFLPASEKRVTASIAAAPRAQSGSGTVLLVEDQAAVRRLTRRILEAHGYSVFDTGDAEAALHVVEEAPADLLLTDVVMPQMNGPDLARLILARAPATRVLFMSGFAGHSALHDIRGAPFIQKPFTPDTLLAKIRDVLESKAPEWRRVS